MRFLAWLVTAAWLLAAAGARQLAPPVQYLHLVADRAPDGDECIYDMYDDHDVPDCPPTAEP